MMEHLLKYFKLYTVAQIMNIVVDPPIIFDKTQSFEWHKLEVGKKYLFVYYHNKNPVEIIFANKYRNSKIFLDGYNLVFNKNKNNNNDFYYFFENDKNNKIISIQSSIDEYQIFELVDDFTDDHFIDIYDTHYFTNTNNIIHLLNAYNLTYLNYYIKLQQGIDISFI